MPGAVRYEGLERLIISLREIGPEAVRDLKEVLRDAGRDVARDATMRMVETDPSLSARIDFRVYVRKTGTVRVEEAKRKTSGDRPEFGAFQMTDGLVPARDATVEEAVKDLEHRISETLRKHGL
jgi:hypothetical protein